MATSPLSKINKFQEDTNEGRSWTFQEVKLQKHRERSDRRSEYTGIIRRNGAPGQQRKEEALEEKKSPITRVEIRLSAFGDQLSVEDQRSGSLRCHAANHEMRHLYDCDCLIKLRELTFEDLWRKPIEMARFMTLEVEELSIVW